MKLGNMEANLTVYSFIYEELCFKGAVSYETLEVWNMG